MNISHLKIGDKFWVRHRKRYYQALEVERQERANKELGLQSQLFHEEW